MVREADQLLDLGNDAPITQPALGLRTQPLASGQQARATWVVL